MTMQRVFAERWKSLDPDANILLIPSIEAAIKTARSLAGADAPKLQALITGSLHLVGGALGILEGADAL